MSDHKPSIAAYLRWSEIQLAARDAYIAGVSPARIRALIEIDEPGMNRTLEDIRNLDEHE